MSDASQKYTDEQYRLHELREGARRFADFGGESLAGAPPLAGCSDHAKASQPVRPLPLLSHDVSWEGWLAKREEIEREEKRAFNERFGYIQ